MARVPSPTPSPALGPARPPPDTTKAPSTCPHHLAPALALEPPIHPHARKRPWAPCRLPTAPTSRCRPQGQGTGVGERASQQGGGQEQEDQAPGALRPAQGVWDSALLGCGCELRGGVPGGRRSPVVRTWLSRDPRGPSLLLPHRRGVRRASRAPGRQRRLPAWRAATRPGPPSGWPSGLRRCVQVAVSPGGVGSNPTPDKPPLLAPTRPGCLAGSRQRPPQTLSSMARVLGPTPLHPPPHTRPVSLGRPASRAPPRLRPAR